MAQQYPNDEERRSFLDATDSSQDSFFEKTTIVKADKRRSLLLTFLIVAFCCALTTVGFLIGRGQSSLRQEATYVAKHQEHSNKTGTYAYATYATGTHSLCDATVAFHTLADVSKTADGTAIDRVIVVPDDLNTTAYEEQFRLLHVTVIRFPRILIEEEKGGYRESLNKLRVFQLPYDRVVYFDNDAVFLRNTDQLFHLAKWAFYAPRAYWLPQPWFQSTLMAVQPSNETFHDIIEHFKTPMAGHAWFDMDVLNDFFKDQVAFLSPFYVILNTEFQKPGYSKSTVWRKKVADLAKEAYIVHFSTSPKLSYGKPEYRQPIEEVGKAHPLFAKTFNMYWDYQEKVCQPL